MKKHARLVSILTHVSYPLRWAAVLSAIFAVLISTAALISDRVRAGARDCIQIEDSYMSRNYYDINTKNQILSPLVTYQTDFIYSAIFTPDAHHLAYLWRSDKDSTDSLFVKATGTSNSDTRLLQNGITSVDARDIRWSPDSRLIAYRWLSTNGVQYVALSDTDGHLIARRVLENAPIDGASVSLHGWSADGKYLAVSIADDLTKTTTIHILSASDLQSIKTPLLTTNVPVRNFGVGDSGSDTYEMVQWGASGDWLDYLISKPDGRNTLVLYSPETGQMLMADTSGPVDRYSVRVLWSPDGNYTAVIYVQDQYNPIWWLDVFGIDGTTFYKVTNNAANMMILAGSGAGAIPRFEWSADGRSLFYLQNLTPRSENHGDLMAFNLDRKQIILVRANIYLNPNMTNDSRYMLAVWDDGNTEKIDIIDTTRLQPVATLDALYTDGGLKQVDGRYSAESGWLIVNEDTIDTWAVNVRTGVHRTLLTAFTTDYRMPVSFTADYRFAGGFETYSPLSPNSDYRVLSLSDGVLHNFHLPPSIVNPTLIDYSPDGEVTLSSADAANYGTRIVVLRSDGSIRRQFTIRGNFTSIRRVTCASVR